MSTFSCHVKNFRVLNSVDLDLTPGVYLVSADNDSGKSTLFKAIKSVLDGSVGDSDNPRNGTDSFSVFMTVDNRSVQVERSGKKTTWTFDGGKPTSKLGRKPLSAHLPDFPFRRIESGNTTFYPNFCFQNDVPLFRDVSVIDLFSSMFGDVSNLSDCSDMALSRSKATDKNVSRLEILATDYSTKLTDTNKKLIDEKSKNPNPRLSPELVDQFKFLTRQLSPDRIEYFNQSVLGNSDLLSRLKTYREYLELDKLVSRHKDLSAQQSEEAPVPLDFKLLGSGTRYFSLLEEIAGISLPDLDLNLLAKGSLYFGLESELNNLGTTLESQKSVLNNLRLRLSDYGCDSLTAGTCPLLSGGSND